MDEALARVRKSMEEPTQAEVDEAHAYLQSLSPEDRAFLDEFESGMRGDAHSTFNYLNRDQPVKGGGAMRAEAEANLYFADGGWQDDGARGLVDYASWAKLTLAAFKPRKRTPEEAAKRAAEWEEITARALQDLERQGVRKGRNERYRSGTSPERAELNRAKNNLRKAEGRLRKATAYVAELEKDVSAGSFLSKASAEVRLPGARAAVAETESTVARWRAAVAAAEKVLAGPPGAEP
jgi:hypothetical protein